MLLTHYGSDSERKLAGKCGRMTKKPTGPDDKLSGHDGFSSGPVARLHFQGALWFGPLFLHSYMSVVRAASTIMQWLQLRRNCDTTAVRLSCDCSATEIASTHGSSRAAVESHWRRQWSNCGGTQGNGVPLPFLAGNAVPLAYTMMATYNTSNRKNVR